MLISFLALIALANGILGGIHNHLGIAWFPSTYQQISARCLRPSHGHWSSLARLRSDWQPSWHPHGVERACGVLPCSDRRKPCSIPGRLPSLRLRLRFRQSQFDWHPAGGIGALAPINAANWRSAHPRHAGGNDGKSNVGFDCRHAFVVDRLCLKSEVGKGTIPLVP